MEENPNLVSPYIDFERDRLGDKHTKILVQDKVGENSTATPVVENQPDVEENSEEKETTLLRKAEIVANQTSLTQQKKKTFTEPKSCNEAINSPQAVNRRKAMRAKYDSLMDNNTWTFVDEPEDQQVLPGNWVCKIKCGENSQVDKLKV